MILTITPNPALDYSIRVDAFELGKRAKYREPVIDPSGKGINVSRMVRRLGEATLAVAFAGGSTGDLLRQGLDREGVPHNLVPVQGLTRINVTVLTGPEGSATHLHGPGPAVSDAEVRGFLDQVAGHLSRARILVLAGSLPPGMGPAFAADLVKLARRGGVRTIVDVEGETLAAAITAGADVVKPNLLEASQFLGRELSGVDGALAGAREIASRGTGSVVVTMRGEGAVALAWGRAWHVRVPREDVVRAIGAGDSFAAGLAVGLGRGVDFSQALRLAAAAGAASAMHSGTGLGTLEEVTRLLERTEVKEL